ncbi:hypothetical protein EI533_05685 [Pseudomonas donghuensis]|nr:hypothetical protein [Pseudomonas donghuensis]
MIQVPVQVATGQSGEQFIRSASHRQKNPSALVCLACGGWLALNRGAAIAGKPAPTVAPAFPVEAGLPAMGP